MPSCPPLPTAHEVVSGCGRCRRLRSVALLPNFTLPGYRVRGHEPTDGDRWCRQVQSAAIIDAKIGPLGFLGGPGEPTWKVVRPATSRGQLRDRNSFASRETPRGLRVAGRTPVVAVCCHIPWICLVVDELPLRVRRQGVRATPRAPRSRCLNHWGERRFLPHAGGPKHPNSILFLRSSGLCLRGDRFNPRPYLKRLGVLLSPVCPPKCRHRMRLPARVC